MPSPLINSVVPTQEVAAPPPAPAPTPSPVANSPSPQSLYYQPAPVQSQSEMVYDSPSVDRGIIESGPSPVRDVTAPATAGSTVSVDQSRLVAPEVAGDMLVANQMRGIIAEDSPLMRQAATRARQQMNGRGLVNSSMAVGAGQSALYDAALPIAKQDAQTNASIASQAYDARVQAAQADARAINDNVRLDASLSQQASLANHDAAVRQSSERYTASVNAAMRDADAASRLQLQQIDAATRTQLVAIEAQYRTQMQTSDSMSRSYQSMVDSIARVMTDPNLDAAGRQAAINNLTALYDGALGVQEAISGLDLGDILQEGGLITAPSHTDEGGAGGSGGGGGSRPTGPNADGTFDPAYYDDGGGNYVGGN